MRRSPALLLLLLGLAACSGHGCGEDEGIAREGAVPRIPTDFMNVSFEELYPYFLYRRSMSEGEKAALWTKYQGHWVRWEGVVASFTDHGVTLKHLLATVTFDVSLTTGGAIAKQLKQRFAVGDRVRYVGRLDGYDDVFRTLYVTQGVVIEKVTPGDLGVIADMAHGTPH